MSVDMSPSRAPAYWMGWRLYVAVVRALRVFVCVCRNVFSSSSFAPHHGNRDGRATKPSHELLLPYLHVDQYTRRWRSLPFWSPLLRITSPPPFSPSPRCLARLSVALFKTLPARDGCQKRRGSNEHYRKKEDTKRRNK
jgi:hypothetical protein